MSATAVSLAIELVIQLLAKSSDIAKIINTVQSEGRSDLTADEWNTVLGAYDTARASLVEAVAKKKAEEAAATPPV